MNAVQLEPDGDTNCSKTLEKMASGGHLQAEDSTFRRQLARRGSEFKLTRQLTDLAQDLRTGGQVEGKPVVAALYWTATIVFAVCVFAVTQAIGGFWDDQDETSFPAKIRAAPAHALRTHEEYYVPSPEVSPTGWLSDQGFLRYSTLVLTLTLALALTLTLTLTLHAP